MADLISVDARAPQWVQALREEIERRFELSAQGPARIKVYRIAQLPEAKRFRGAHVHVDDTNKPAWSDGTVWRYFDGSAV